MGSEGSVVAPTTHPGPEAGSRLTADYKAAEQVTMQGPREAIHFCPTCWATFGQKPRSVARPKTKMPRSPCQ